MEYHEHSYLVSLLFAAPFLLFTIFSKFFSTCILCTYRQAINGVLGFEYKNWKVTIGDIPKGALSWLPYNHHTLVAVLKNNIIHGSTMHVLGCALIRIQLFYMCCAIAYTKKSVTVFL